MAWCIVMAITTIQAALDRSRDPMADLDASFRPFAAYLPASGTIGYLDPYQGWSEEAVRTHYAAQYALAPRIVATRLDQRFLIVANGAAMPGGDARLDDFVEVARSPAGHRVFRRFP